MLIFSLILLLVLLTAGMILMMRNIMNQNVIAATRHLDELSQDYLKKEEEVNRRLDETKQKCQEMLGVAQQEAEKLREETRKEIEEEKEKVLNQARTQGESVVQQAEKSRQLLLAEINDRIDKEAINKACELIQNTLPERFKQDVHGHWVEELIKEGFGHLKNLRIPEDIQEVKISSAFVLAEEERKTLHKKIKEALGRDCGFKEEVDPRVVAGLVITIGSLVLDGSLKNKIQEQAKSAQHAAK
jgi:F0F1-type ATP synthase delta subunit